MLKILSALAVLFPVLGALAADATNTFKVGEFTFTRPPKWQWIESTSVVVKARLQLNGATRRERAEIVFIQSDPRAKSSLTRKAADRYFRELTGPNVYPPPPLTVTNIAGHKLIFLNLRPASERGQPRPFEVHKPGTRQVAAFVEIEQGSVFINFTGWTELVDESEAEFLKMVEAGIRGK